MRREVFVEALENVIRALESANIEDALEPGSGQDPSRISSIIKAFGRVSVEFERFTPEEWKIIDEFELRDLYDPNFWNKVASIERMTGSGEIWNVRGSVMYLINYGTHIINLLRRDADTQPVVVKDVKGHGETTLAGKMTFLIKEGGAPSLTTRQMVEIMNGIESLYGIVCEIYSIDTSELVIGNMDSGSDKSFDVLGVADGIAKLSNFILECWDRVRYGRSQKLTASVKSAAESLSLLAAIKTAEEKKVITPAQAEKMRRTVVRSVDDLFSSGVYTKDMEKALPIAPAEIPVERRKLITVYAKDERIDDEGARRPRQPPE